MEPTIRQTAQWLRRREAEARARARERADGLRALMPEAAGTLRALGAGRVWLFGSLATGDVHEESDVDLAVEGLPADRHQEALTALMILFPCGVDLVRWEQSPDSLRERITGEGTAL